jgi:uncharacterized protein YkwD
VTSAINAINAHRTASGCSALTVNSSLSAASQWMARDMAIHNYGSATASDGSSPGQRITRNGYSWSSYSESHGLGFTSPTAVVNFWWGSSGAHAAITNCRMRNIGLGYYYQSNDQANVRLSYGSTSYNNGPFYHYWVFDVAYP